MTQAPFLNTSFIRYFVPFMDHKRYFPNT